MLILVAMLPLFSLAQKVGLVDRSLRKPVQYVENLEMDHIMKGYFTINKDDIPKVVSAITDYRKLIENGDKFPDKMKSVITGATYFTAGGRKGNYNLVIDTKINKMGSYFILANKDWSKEENLARIDAFIDYISKG